MKTYLVGGAVRDELLHIPNTEKDWVVVGATVEEMTALGFKPVGKDFPVFLHPKTHEEYALARTERKTGRGYTQFAFHADPSVTLEDDLKRRDLTINAIAKTDTGEFIDPYGGKKDIENRILRHVSEAFIEDPVRILRMARFAARFGHLGFVIHDDTLKLLRHMVQNGEVNALVAERVWQEFSQALSEKNPELFFEVLRNCGALRVLFPEIDRLFGVPNPIKWHPEVDTGVHTLLVLQAACRLSIDPKVRFAALLHDVGKGLTNWTDWPHHHGHEKIGLGSVSTLCKRYKVPTEYSALARLVSRYHGLCHKSFELKASTLIKLLRKLDVQRKPERFEQFLLACEADFHGRPGFENEPYPQTVFLKEAANILKQVAIKPILNQGLNGEDLKQAILQAQVSALKAYLISKR